VEPTTESSTLEKTERITNWEIDKEEILQRFAPGSVKRLTVAVVVDQELDAYQEDQLQRMVETAVGIDRDSPDQSSRTVSVTGMRFSQIQETPAEKTIWQALPWYVWILLAVLALVIVILLLRLISRRKPDEEELQFEAVADEELKLRDLLDKDLSPEEKEKKMIREEIENLWIQVLKMQPISSEPGSGRKGCDDGYQKGSKRKTEGRSSSDIPRA
jgi:flagellar M-ring protein FliF